MFFIKSSLSEAASASVLTAERAIFKRLNKLSRPFLFPAPESIDVNSLNSYMIVMISFLLNFIWFYNWMLILW